MWGPQTHRSSKMVIGTKYQFHSLQLKHTPLGWSVNVATQVYINHNSYDSFLLQQPHLPLDLEVVIPLILT